MLRRILFFVLPLIAIFSFSKSASAQVFYPEYGVGSPMEYSYTFTPQPPRARHDNRIDPRLLRAARIAEEHAYPHSICRCWRYVKDALIEAGAVKERPTTNYACEAGSELQNKYGFVRLPIHDPYRAPVGSVLVYSGGGAGHVEFRTEHGFASDYRSAWRCRYHLIGVYAKLSV
ncbi:MAG TPA: hypothetical protein VHY22_10540 [Chthoniobacteraceae bacterium]|jgi:hypothetical protein|nr:hypothetical protein [Chthoniobacteraceae bacterium]